MKKYLIDSKSLNLSINLIISHVADIDGCGAVVLAKLYNPNTDVILVENSELDFVLSELANGDMCKRYSHIYITDLPIRKTGIEIIEANEELQSKIIHYDHHTSEVGQDVEFLNVIPEINGEKTCGTSLIYNYFKKQNLNNRVFNSDYVKDFVEAIRCRDNWLSNKPGFATGNTLSDLFTFFGQEEWINRFVEKSSSLNEKQITFSQDERAILKSLKNDMETYIDECEKRMHITTYKDYKIGLVAAERFRSELGNILASRNPNLDFIAIVDLTRQQISLRGVKDNIDLGMIVKSINPQAGGQKKAAGIPIGKDDVLENIFDNVFKK